MQELVDVRIVRVPDRVAIVRVGDLAEAVEIQLPDEARDVGGLEDGPSRIQVLRLELPVLEQYRVAVRAPSDRAALALVHDPPELLRESHRLQHAVLVHRTSSGARRCLGGDTSAKKRSLARFERESRMFRTRVTASRISLHAQPARSCLENKQTREHPSDTRDCRGSR